MASYNASGSAASFTCTGLAGDTHLTACTGGALDFAVGQGVMVRGAGPSAATQAIATPPIIQAQGQGGTGSHTYCYVVSTVDPLDGVSAPSPQTCVANQPALSYFNTWNALLTTTSNVGPSPTFLWYVSTDGGDFNLVSIEGFSSSAMDVGQRPGSRGGWPATLPAGNYSLERNEDFFTTVAAVDGPAITLADPLPTSVQNTAVLHDDTGAIQATIDAAVGAGGGIVQFGSGTFQIRRPSFIDIVNAPLPYPAYTTQLAMDPWWAQFSRLHIANGSTGHIHLQGMGAATTLITPPDHGGDVTLLAVGNFERPAYTTTGRFKMSEVAKGATQLTVTQVVGGDTLAVGDDIWLYSGSFATTPCPDRSDSANDCHYSELNTISAIDGNTISLAYPASKHYFDDGGSSYGFVKLPVTPHDIALQHLHMVTFDPVTFTGLVYGMLVDDVSIDGYISHQVFGGGFKRDVMIQNSSWGFGSGDVSYSATDEFDQFTNVSFLNNTIRGYAAPGAEGPSVMARIYGTEGSSQFTYRGNHFINASIYFDQTTDDVIAGNDFQNGVISVGYAFGNQPNPFQYGYYHDRSFLSYDSQETLDVEQNTLSDDAAFVPPYIIRGGHYATSTIDRNVITYAGPRQIPAIYSYSGEVSGNTITLTGSTGSVGIALVGDQAVDAPAGPFTVRNNLLSISNGYAGIFIPDPGFTDTAPICLKNNTMLSAAANQVAVANPNSVGLSCSE